MVIATDNIPYEKVGDTVTPLEVPFEIPESWEWVRLGSICVIARGGSPRPIKQYLTDSPTGINWIKIGDSDKGRKYINQTKEKIIPEGVSKSRLVHKGDFLLTNSMSFGRPYILNVDGCIHDGWLVLSGYSQCFDKNFLFYLLSSRFAYYQFCDVVSGAVVKNLNSDKVAAALFPLPPLSEQCRIVQVIERIEPLISEYDGIEQNLFTLNETFPNCLKKSILQQAVQGKLVPQDPVDEPAAVLLERIRAEKQRFVQEGKIKKDKHESIIFRRDNSHYELVDGVERCIDEELPFEIPENWVWVRFSNLMKFISTGPFGSMLHKSDYILNGIPLVNPANIINGKIVPSDKMMVSQLTQERLNSYILEAGMIVMGRRGEMGRCAVVTENESGWLCGTGSFFMKPIEGVYAGYISLLFSTPYAKYYLGGESVGTTMSNLNHKILSTMPIPFPPLGEQMRIVAKIEKLLPIVKSL